MTRQDLLPQLNDIFNDILDQQDITLKETTTAADVKDWDSLSHIQLIVAIEKHFRIKFTTAEISNFRNVGEMCDAILKKTG
jgi:acyl carrier protein